MRPRIRKAVARAYRLTTRPPAPGADEPVEVEPGFTVPRFVLEWSRSGPEDARVFLARLPTVVELEGRSVLALGRGAADLGVEVAGRRPRRVIAIDMVTDRMRLAQVRLAEGARLPVEFRPFRGSFAELGDTRFDVVLAMEPFRRYGAERSSRHVEELVTEMSSHVPGRGLLAVGFSPPWKAPHGGGGDSRLPWAHLLFPESVIFEEYRRVRSGNRARRFEDVGFNRITLARFRQAMSESGLECLSLRTNVSESRAVKAMRALALIPPLEEYFTENVYGVWLRP
jgi:predicted RNA methylase